MNLILSQEKSSFPISKYKKEKITREASFGSSRVNLLIILTVFPIWRILSASDDKNAGIKQDFPVRFYFY